MREVSDGGSEDAIPDGLQDIGPQLEIKDDVNLNTERIETNEGNQPAIIHVINRECRIKKLEMMLIRIQKIWNLHREYETSETHVNSGEVSDDPKTEKLVVGGHKILKKEPRLEKST